MEARWIPLPEGDDAVGWPLRVAAFADPGDRVALSRSLAAGLVRAERRTGDRAARLVLLDDPPAVVRAWALASRARRDPSDAESAASRFAAAVQRTDAARRPVWARSVDVREVGGDPAVVVRELPVDPGTGAVRHRVVVARFPRTAAQVIRLTVSTATPGAVPDLPAEALALAGSIDPVPRGAS